MIYVIPITKQKHSTSKLFTIFIMIYEFYCDLIRKKTGENLDKHMRKLLEMYCQASIYMTVQWLMKGMKESEEELADLMIDAMPDMLHKLFKEIDLV